MKSLFATLMLVACSATAQNLKWSITMPASSWATDGHGALAVIGHLGAPFQLGAVTWINHAGRPLFTNIIADLGQNYAGSSLRVVRFNARELVVQVEAAYEYAPGTNYLRRIKRDGTFKDTVLPVGESMDELSTKLLDNHGYFTRETSPAGSVIFRRYSK